jgi:hypothetical protein
MAKKKNEDVESVDLSALSPKEVAEIYFDAHPDFPFDSVFVAEDGVIFSGDLKGYNACFNYCKDKGIGFEQVNK